jgi:hypothetical protein
MVFGGGGGDDAAYRDIVFGDARSASTSSGGAGAAGGGLGKDEWHAGAASGDGEGGLADWMRIDIAALDGCLRRAPIHERLKLPRHVGEHLEGRYGVGSGSGSGGGGRGRTKTLAIEGGIEVRRRRSRDGVRRSSSREGAGGRW